MHFEIAPKIFEKFPGLNIGAIVAKNLDNSGAIPEINNLLREQESRIRASYNTETLSQNPKIDCWRKAYSAFGGKPKENRSSVENLYRAVLQGNDLRHINKLVDIYNLISLKHMLPVGGEDIDKIQGAIQLTFAGANEPALLLLGDKEARPPHQGEVIYKDSLSAICRRWNWREADRTKLSEQTKNCILVIEGLPPAAKSDVENATRELSDLVKKFCNGNVSYKILDERNPRIEF